MRISGGSLRGRQVQVPQGIIRPAMDRMRESVFAKLGDLDQCAFLDMFSGSGIIALEAASRGANPIEAVEKDPLKWKTLIKNVAIAPVRIQCRFMAAEHYIHRARRSFGVIFCDPPFAYRFKGELVRAIAASPLIQTGSRLLLHRPQEDPYLEDLGGAFSVEKVMLEESKRYGRSVVDFFVWR
ncbi:MAG: RsmD family RNA methyltransferase [Treponema sp.]|jgi:16S rRNA (guanine(966)-N(2))-methyltransferase RsmD|nr:RsmD family RNA methyltransferase [Treponema sp.]